MAAQPRSAEGEDRAADHLPASPSRLRDGDAGPHEPASRRARPADESLDALAHPVRPRKDKTTIDRFGKDAEDCACHGAVRQTGARPDPKGNYPTDPRGLPPGLAGKPLITAVYLVNGLPQGGVTFLVDVDGAKRTKGAKSKRTKGAKSKRKS